MSLIAVWTGIWNGIVHMPWNRTVNVLTCIAGGALARRAFGPGNEASYSVAHHQVLSDDPIINTSVSVGAPWVHNFNPLTTYDD